MQKISYLGLAAICGILLMAAGCSCASSTVDIEEPLTLTVTSTDGTLQGAIGVTPTEKNVRAVYQIVGTVDLPANPSCAQEPCVRHTYSYDYITQFHDSTNDDSDGSFSPIRCNTDVIPKDPINSEPDYYSCEFKDEPTNKFYWTFERSYPSLAALKEVTILDIYDAQGYWVKYDEQTNEEGVTYYSEEIDDERVIAENDPIKTFTLLFE